MRRQNEESSVLDFDRIATIVLLCTYFDSYNSYEVY